MMNTPNLSHKRSFSSMEKSGKKTPATPASTPRQERKPLGTSQSNLLDQLLKLQMQETQADAFTRTEHELKPPAAKRPRPLDLDNEDTHTTEARIEGGSFKPDNLFTEAHKITGLVEMPKASVPTVHTEEDADEGPSLGRHSDKPDAVFSFLLDAFNNRK
jgi:hypothetical protein